MTRIDSLSLEGKTALVTGASRGIGSSVAQTLAERGAAVAVHYSGVRSGADEEAASTVSRITERGGRAFALPLDFTTVHPARLIEEFSALAQGSIGTGRLDILVNNAAYSRPTPFAETTAELFDRHIAVNLRAPFLLTQAAAAVMPEGGAIVNISSSTTRVIAPDQASYTTSKGGLNTMTWYLAKELAARGIRLNAVIAGVTRTELSYEILGDAGYDAMASASPFGRLGEGDDIADVVAFLASDSARWVVGHAIDATGGQILL